MCDAADPAAAGAAAAVALTSWLQAVGGAVDHHRWPGAFGDGGRGVGVAPRDPPPADGKLASKTCLLRVPEALFVTARVAVLGLEATQPAVARLFSAYREVVAARGGGVPGAGGHAASAPGSLPVASPGAAPAADDAAASAASAFRSICKNAQ